MSDTVLSFVLAVIQGLTEFLPISSSAHLLLPSLLFGLNDLGLSFDIAVLFVGVFQSLALLPGASRSGTAITAALLLGFNLKDASKFSFMLGIPTIFGALVLLIIEMQSTFEAFNYMNLIIGFFISMIIAFLTIKLFLNFVERIGMIPFVIYRIILGFFLIILI